LQLISDDFSIARRSCEINHDQGEQDGAAATP